MICTSRVKTYFWSGCRFLRCRRCSYFSCRGFIRKHVLDVEEEKAEATNNHGYKNNWGPHLDLASFLLLEPAILEQYYLTDSWVIQSRQCCISTSPYHGEEMRTSSNNKKRLIAMSTGAKFLQNNDIGVVSINFGHVIFWISWNPL